MEKITCHSINFYNFTEIVL